MKEKLIFAGFWIRFIAYIIDFIIILLVFYLFGIISRAFNLSIAEDFIDILELPIIGTIILFLIFILYHSVFLTIKSTTPGKKILGLKVVNKDFDKNLTFIKSFVRSSISIFSILFPFIFLVIAINKKKHEGIHDIIAKTYVIRSKNT